MKTLLVALVVLVVWIGTASAECAYVLWGRSMGTEWHLMTGHRSIQECDQALKTLAQRNKREGGSVTEGEVARVSWTV